jgi:hypothetical protein
MKTVKYLITLWFVATVGVSMLWATDGSLVRVTKINGHQLYEKYENQSSIPFVNDFVLVRKEISTLVNDVVTNDIRVYSGPNGAGTISHRVGVRIDPNFNEFTNSFYSVVVVVEDGRQGPFFGRTNYPVSNWIGSPGGNVGEMTLVFGPTKHHYEGDCEWEIDNTADKDTGYGINFVFMVYVKISGQWVQKPASIVKNVGPDEKIRFRPSLDLAVKALPGLEVGTYMIFSKIMVSGPSVETKVMLSQKTNLVSRVVEKRASAIDKSMKPKRQIKQMPGKKL